MTKVQADSDPIWLIRKSLGQTVDGTTRESFIQTMEPKVHLIVKDNLARSHEEAVENIVTSRTQETQLDLALKLNGLKAAYMAYETYFAVVTN